MIGAFLAPAGMHAWSWLQHVTLRPASAPLHIVSPLEFQNQVKANGGATRPFLLSSSNPTSNNLLEPIARHEVLNLLGCIPGR